MMAALLSRAPSGTSVQRPTGLAQFAHVWLRATDGAWEEAVLLVQIAGLEWVVCEHDGALSVKELGGGVRLRPPATGGSSSITVRALQATEDWDQLARDASLIADARREEQHGQMLHQAEHWLQNQQSQGGPQAAQLESLLEVTAQRLSALEEGLGGLGGLLQHQASGGGEVPARQNVGNSSSLDAEPALRLQHPLPGTETRQLPVPQNAGVALENIQEASEETSPLAAGHRDADPDHAYVASTAPTSRVTSPMGSPRRAPSDASVDTMELHREREACLSTSSGGALRRDGSIADEDPLSTTASAGTAGSHEVRAPCPSGPRVSKLPLHIITRVEVGTPSTLPMSGGSSISKGYASQWISWQSGRAPTQSPQVCSRNDGSNVSSYGHPPSTGSPPTPAMATFSAAVDGRPLTARSLIGEADEIVNQWKQTSVRPEYSTPADPGLQALTARSAHGGSSPPAPPLGYPAITPSTIRASGSFIKAPLPQTHVIPAQTAPAPVVSQAQQPSRHLVRPVPQISGMSVMGQATPAVPRTQRASAGGMAQVDGPPLSARGEELGQRRRSSSPLASRRRQSVGPRTSGMQPCQTIPARGLHAAASYTGHSPRLSTSPTPRVIVSRVSANPMRPVAADASHAA
mmetsp:Transcript_15189/g.34637  ORF Transcript_15189/g.34637 Transcript_15189/m.34637 type:complete len:634 (-) Transcript_15189:87-1988(-)